MKDHLDLLANRAFETYAEQVPEIREQFGSGPHPKLEEPFLGYWRAVVIAVLSEYQTAKPLSAITPDHSYNPDSPVIEPTADGLKL
jgi:hypothetical protein